MHLHYFTLKRQVEYLNGIATGSQIIQSFTQFKNEWHLEIQSPAGESQFLQLSCDPQFPFFIHSEKIHRRSNSTDVLVEVLEKTIDGIHIWEGERVIEILLKETSDRILVQLFTLHSNFFYVDEKFTILNSFKKRTHFQGTIFQLPSSTRLDPTQIQKETFKQILAESPELSLNTFLKNRFKYFSSIIIEEICYRAGIDRQKLTPQLTEAETNRLYEELEALFLQFQKEAAVVYYREGLPHKFTLGEFKILRELERETFDNINLALRKFNFLALKSRSIINKKNTLTRVLSTRLQYLQRVQKKLSAPSDASEKKEEFQKIGQLLLAQPQKFQPNQNTVAIVDYFDPNLPTIQVTIDPSLSINENAQKYFEKAKNIEEKVKRRKKHLQEVENMILRIQQYQKQIAESQAIKALEKLETQLKQEHLLQTTPENTETFRLPFKKYSFKNFEIWVGKSARDNDEMTYKYAHKEDWWFHVQGYHGAHVIVRNPQKKEALPPEVISYAARLAVTQSEAKHARYVPVIYTRVKYVRKPRKSPPGTVAPSQTKTVFADPM